VWGTAPDGTEGEVPDGVGALIVSVDTQGSWLEVALKGYGVGEESWLLAWSQLHGDPGREEVWRDLDKFLARSWLHVSGQRLKPDAVVIDSGGLHTDHVYRYVKVRQHRKIFAIRGGNAWGTPLVSRPSTANRYHVKLFTLGVNAGKDIVMSRLHIQRAGPGFMHLPAWVDDEYLHQLTAERALRKYVKGKGSVREWVKVRDRNEAFDLEVYALAGLRIMGPPLIGALGERAVAFSKRLVRLPDGSAPAPDAPAAPKRPPRRGGWATRW
jgi:phage terminase large subunit GpA-like protein